MARSDFNYTPVNQLFNDANSTFETNFIVDLSSSQSVVDDGYLLITVRSVDFAGHQILINNTQLGSFDIPLPPGDSDAWLTYMDRIEPGILRGGTNELEIRRKGSDNFVVKDVVVHWRETG